MTELNELKRQRDAIYEKIKEIELSNKKNTISELEEKYVEKTFLDFDSINETYYYVLKVLTPYKLLCTEVFIGGNGYHAVSEFEEVDVHYIESNFSEINFEDFYGALKDTKNYIDNILNLKKWGF